MKAMLSMKEVRVDIERCYRARVALECTLDWPAVG
jgi:hypothetical protein